MITSAKRTFLSPMLMIWRLKSIPSQRARYCSQPSMRRTWSSWCFSSRRRSRRTSLSVCASSESFGISAVAAWVALGDMCSSVGWSGAERVHHETDHRALGAITIGPGDAGIDAGIRKPVGVGNERRQDHSRGGSGIDCTKLAASRSVLEHALERAGSAAEHLGGVEDRELGKPGQLADRDPEHRGLARPFHAVPEPPHKSLQPAGRALGWNRGSGILHRRLGHDRGADNLTEELVASREVALEGGGR